MLIIFCSPVSPDVNTCALINFMSCCIYENCDQLSFQVALVTSPHSEASVSKAFSPNGKFTLGTGHESSCV